MTQQKPACIVVEGMEQVEEWIGIHGSIASGKSTLMRCIEKYIDRNKQNAENPSHIDESEPDKIYYLLVDEPVDEWSAPIHQLPDSEEKLSMLEIFYRDIEGMGLAFQVHTFTTRLDRLTTRLNKIAPASFHRRIVVISERTMRSDRVFYHTVSKYNLDHNINSAQIHRFIYDQFFDLICSDVLKKEKRLIYIPTPPEICAIRQNSRAREGESCSIDYLCRLDKTHREMIAEFDTENVIRLDRFNQHLQPEEIDLITSTLMQQLLTSK